MSRSCSITAGCCAEIDDPEQLKLMAEECIVVDDQGKRIFLRDLCAVLTISLVRC